MVINIPSIRESILSYPGNCPCPYKSAKNSSKCGKRSAYSKPRGYSPICYKSDVSKKMIKNYKNKQKNKNTSTSRKERPEDNSSIYRKPIFLKELKIR